MSQKQAEKPAKKLTGKIAACGYHKRHHTESAANIHSLLQAPALASPGLLTVKSQDKLLKSPTNHLVTTFEPVTETKENDQISNDYMHKEYFA
jgi:hypothetical protein